jgi:hypothetical protein
MREECRPWSRHVHVVIVSNLGGQLLWLQGMKRMCPQQQGNFFHELSQVGHDFLFFQVLGRSAPRFNGHLIAIYGRNTLLTSPMHHRHQFSRFLCFCILSRSCTDGYLYALTVLNEETQGSLCRLVQPHVLHDESEASCSFTPLQRLPSESSSHICPLRALPLT